MQLTVTSEVDRGSGVLILAGELSIFTAAHLRNACTQMVSSEYHHLVLDLNEVTFLDSAGLGVIVGALKRTRRENGSLRLICDRHNILRLFTMTGLTKIFDVYPDRKTLFANGVDSEPA